MQLVRYVNLNVNHMKNKELITKINNRIKGKERYYLKTPINIVFAPDDVDSMDSIVKDNDEYCLASKTWLLPLNEMTNKELIELKKAL